MQVLTIDIIDYYRSTQNDEMCNFYMMYYTEEGDKTMPSTYCFSQGPPDYYWASDPKMAANIKTIPETASVIPGTDKVLLVNISMILISRLYKHVFT